MKKRKRWIEAAVSGGAQVFVSRSQLSRRLVRTVVTPTRGSRTAIFFSFSFLFGLYLVGVKNACRVGWGHACNVLGGEMVYAGSYS